MRQAATTASRNRRCQATGGGNSGSNDGGSDDNNDAGGGGGSKRNSDGQPEDAMVKVCPCWPLARGWIQVTNLGGNQLIVFRVYSTSFPDSYNSDMLLTIMICPVSALLDLF